MRCLSILQLHTTRQYLVMAENQNQHALSARQRQSFADRFLIITYERVILVMLKSKVRDLQCQVVVGDFQANRRSN